MLHMVSVLHSYINNFSSLVSNPSQKKTTCQQLTKRLSEILCSRSYFLNSEDEETIRAAQEFLCTYYPQNGAAELSHYTLAALKAFPQAPVVIQTKSLQAAVEKRQAPLLKKWFKLNFSTEIFFGYPDFVSFLFKHHLDKNLKLFGHGIETFGGMPHLKVNGKWKSWDWIKENIDVVDGTFCDKDTRQRYTYLENGLTFWDSTQWTTGIRLCNVPNPDRVWKLQVVTSLLPPTWISSLLDPGLNYRGGHAYIRLINPFGDVYSYGRWRHEKDLVTNGGQLMNVRSQIRCPDTAEFMPRDLVVTTLPIDASTAYEIEDYIQTTAQAVPPFHFFESNCTTFVVEVLQKAGITLNIRSHISEIASKIITAVRPLSWIRQGCSYFLPSVIRVIPKKIKQIALFVCHLIIMCIAAPIFTTLGVWKRGKEATPAYYASLADLLNVDKARVFLPQNLITWQKSLGAQTVVVQQ